MRCGLWQLLWTGGAAFAAVTTVRFAPVGDAYGDALTVRTETGMVTGNVGDGIASFKGIPYATPPVDSLRWRAPRPAASWPQPLIANDYGPSCTQPLPVRGVPAGSRAGTASEDCLTLNVWTLVRHDRPLPVMIWIHGGANTEGTSGRTLYDGGHFARDSVILVSVNYRLGLLGFFAHPSLAREAGSEITANFGLLDQLAAIRWVRRNIAVFGGDTNNITVFGESAGGQDIVALLATAPMHGLVQKAIAESPANGWGDPPTLAVAEREGAQLATKAGLSGATATLEQLRAVPATSLVKLASLDNTRPILDGKLLTEPPLTAFANGHAADVPLIIGTNSNEGSLIPATARAGLIFPRLLNLTALAEIRTHYDPSTDDAAFARLLFRDGFFAGPVRWIADHGAAGAPVFLYRFDHVVTQWRATRPGAGHGSELPFVFQNWSDPPTDPADKAVDQAMHSCWVAFAKAGAPTCAGLPNWTPYQPAEGKLMLISGDPGMRSNPVAALLDLLEQRLHH